MILPESTKVEFWQELKVYEEDRKMRYITSVEQIGYDRGQSVGYDRGVEAEAQRSRERERSIALNLLRQGLTIEIIVQATGLTVTQLQEMQNQLS